MKITSIVLVSLLSGILCGCSSGMPDCADQTVKDTLTENIVNAMAGSGIPDLVARIKEGKVKVTLDTISEIARNKESKFVQCAGNLTVQFPDEDIERARKSEAATLAMATKSDFTLPENSKLVAAIKFKASAPADKAESKGGPIVEIVTGAPQPLDELASYISAYTMLAFSAPDIDPNSRNTKPWDHEVHEEYVQSCMKQSGRTSEQCSCKSREIEKLLPQENLMRIGFAIKTSPFTVNKFPYFVKVSQSLDAECPLARSDVTSGGPEIPGGVSAVGPVPDSDDSVANPSSGVDQSKARAVPSAGPSAAYQNTAGPAPNLVEASFDCTKARTSTEKLICSIPQAAAADKRLASAYSDARKKSSDMNGLKAEQLRWMKDVRDKCTDGACMAAAMDSRAEHLRAE